MSPACGSCDVWRNSVRPLILFLLVFVELYDARPPEVRIGGVFDLGSYQGKQSNAAIQLAIQDVNNNPNILNETILEIQTTKIGSSALIDAENVLKLFRANVVSVVAPMTAQVSNFVSVLADSAQVPLITFAGNDPSMSLKQSAYSIQMIGRDVLQMKAIAVLLNKFHWREIVVIYQEDELGLSGILALKNALQETSARIVQKFGVSEESFSNSSWKHIRKTLKENKIRSRAFVIHTSYGLAQKIFLEAKTSGIMEKRGWAWIVTEWVANYLDVPDDTTMDSMQGIIGVRTKARQTPQYKNISKRCNHEFMRLYPNVTHSEDIGIVGAYAYDSIWVIAKAIDTMFRVNKLTELEFKSSEKFSTDVHVFQGGNALLQKVAQSNFEGIGGNIKFSKNRLLEVESYDIVNVVNREIRVVGSWAKKEFKLKDNIEWPNGSPKPPSGYRKFIVGVPPHVVFPGFVNITNNNTEFEGFCIDVFKSAVEMLDYPFHYEFKVSDNGTECPDYSKLVDQVVSKKFDIIVADITILAKRSAKVDFTQPYTDTGLVIMQYLFFSLHFLFGYWNEMRTTLSQDSLPSKCKFPSGFHFQQFVFVHREKVMTSLGKVILIIWLFVVLVLNSSYTASLASILTVQQLSPTIRDIESLRANNASIGHLNGSFVRDYLINELKIDERRLLPLVNPEDYVNSLRNETIGSVVDETPYINMLMSQHCGEFEIVSRPFYKGGFGFLFAKGFPVVGEMTSAVLKIIQNKTELDKLRRHWFGRYSSDPCNNDNGGISEEDTVDDGGKLSPRRFWGLFVISSALYCVIMSAHVGQKYYKKRLVSTRVENVPSPPPDSPLPATEFIPANSDPSRSSGQFHTNNNNTTSNGVRHRRSFSA
ncbi:hypothetical protein SUGI_0710270 [Cryptomeria japonica]|nr:hypothetical protein SUGI_0710270 [Cryptomeria japonica]